MRKYAISAFALFIAAGLLFSGCQTNKTEAVKSVESPPVSKVEVTIKPAPKKVNYTVKTMDIPYEKFTSPAILGKELYLCVHTSNLTDSLYDQLISINLDTKKEEILYKSQHKLAAVQGAKCNDRWLLWIGLFCS